MRGARLPSRKHGSGGRVPRAEVLTRVHRRGGIAECRHALRRRSSIRGDVGDVVLCRHIAGHPRGGGGQRAAGVHDLQTVIDAIRIHQRDEIALSAETQSAAVYARCG